MVRFRATLEPVPHGGCHVVVPAAVAERAGLVYRDRVRGTVRGVAYRSALMKYGGRWHMGLRRTTLEAAHVALGDRIVLTLERDPEPLPTDAVPEDLGRALEAQPGARAAFDALAPSQRRERVKGVLDAKRAETRARRVERCVKTLLR